MGLITDPERARIRSLLGWGARWHHLQTRLESAFNAMDQLPDDVNQIRTYLTQLTSIDSLIAEAQGIIGVKRTGSIELVDDQGIGGLRSEGRRLVEAIDAILGAGIKRNFYGGGMQGGAIQSG